MQLFTPGQLRQMHEDRIAPYIKRDEVAKPENRIRKDSTMTLSMIIQPKPATQS